MSELTDDQKKHIQGTNFWIRAQKNYIDNILVGLGNSERMVKNHLENIELCKEQLPIEEQFLKDGIANFMEWCAVNNIDSEVVNKV